MQLIKAVPIVKIVLELFITALVAGCLILSGQLEDSLLRFATTAICVAVLVFRTYSVYFTGLTDGLSAVAPLLRAIAGDAVDNDEDICFCGQCDDKKKVSIVVAPKDEEKTK